MIGMQNSFSPFEVVIEIFDHGRNLHVPHAGHTGQDLHKLSQHPIHHYVGKITTTLISLVWKIGCHHILTFWTLDTTYNKYVGKMNSLGVLFDPAYWLVFFIRGHPHITSPPFWNFLTLPLVIINFIL